MRIFDKVLHVYLLLVVFLSPCYVVSMKGGGDSYVGSFVAYMDLGSLLWMALLSIGWLFAFVKIIAGVHRSIIVLMMVLIYSLFITYAKFSLNEFDTFHFGVAWIVLVVLVSKMDAENVLRVVYRSSAYLIFINLILSVNHALYKVGVTSRIYLDTITDSMRSSGIFDTPLALGVFSLFTFFLVLSFPKNKYKFRKTIAFFALSCLILSISKGSMLFFMLSFVSIYMIKIMKSHDIYVSRSLVFFVSVLIFFPVMYFGYRWSMDAGVFSALYKPYAIWSFIEVLITNPQVLLFGFSSYTSDEFIRVLHSYGSFRGAVSMESWLIHLVVYYGIGFVAALFWLAYKSVKLNAGFLDDLYLGGAFITAFASSFISNGGLQPPTSLIFYMLVGALIYSRHSGAVFSNTGMSLKRI